MQRHIKQHGVGFQSSVALLEAVNEAETYEQSCELDKFIRSTLPANKSCNISLRSLIIH